MNSNYFLLIACAIACFIQSANSIQCYQCTASRDDPDCNRKHEVDCNHVDAPESVIRVIQQQAQNWNSGNTPNYNNGNQNWNGAVNFPSRLTASGCLKKTYKTYENKLLVERGCFFGDLRNQTAGCTPNSYTGSGIGMQQKCDVCVTDRCNNSTTILPKFTTITLMILLMTFFGKIFIF